MQQGRNRTLNALRGVTGFNIHLHQAGLLKNKPKYTKIPHVPQTKQPTTTKIHQASVPLQQNTAGLKTPHFNPAYEMLAENTAVSP